MGDDDTRTPATAPASEPPALPSAPRSSNPLLVSVSVTPAMHAAVDEYLLGKGMAYLDSLLALVSEVEAVPACAP